jgi:hypothetical protein
MMMMDLLADHGLRAASFMDNLRGAPDEAMVERLKIARLSGRAAQHQGHRFPDRDRIAFAGRTDQSARRFY